MELGEINMNSLKEINKELVEHYLKDYNTNQKYEHYHMQVKCLEKLFFKDYPLNTQIEDVLAKVATLNDLYSTNIRATYAVAKHIISLNIDMRLEKGDSALVNDIANVQTVGKKFYSFATKYCSNHKPDLYPIYDSNVALVLRKYKGEKYTNHLIKDFKNYPIFKEVINDFRNFYNLNDYDYRKLDHFLWRYGHDLKNEKEN